MTDIPKYVEGQDLFDDQSFAQSVIASHEQAPEQQEAKKQILADITRSLIDLGVEERDIPEIILTRFGVPLSDMGGSQLLEIKSWIEQRLVVHVYR